MSSDAPPKAPAPPRRGTGERIALAVAGLLLVAAFAAEPLGWWGGDVHQWLPPLSAHLDPALGPGLPLAVPVAAAVVCRGPALARSLAWRRLLWATWLAGVLWGFGLALLRGWRDGVVAVLVTLRLLEDERRARAAAPFLALTPLVIWIVVSTDAVSMAVVAWGIALLAGAATAVRPQPRLVLSIAAGIVLGIGLFLSYGLVLMAPIAVAVLLASRSWRPLVPALVASLAVVAAFAAAGFWWVEGEQLLVIRYYEGKGAIRPYSYWVWGNLAVAAFALGPAVVAGLGAAAVRMRRWSVAAPSGLLAAGAVIAILGATLSGLSKSEVERIWLPFLLWLVPLTANLPAGRQRRWLAASAVWALAAGVLLRTTW